MEPSFELPFFIDLSEYRDNSIFNLSQFNYKLDAQIMRCAKTQQPFSTVLDTGEVLA